MRYKKDIEDDLDDGNIAVEAEQDYVGSACVACRDENVLERVGDYHPK